VTVSRLANSNFPLAINGNDLSDKTVPLTLGVMTPTIATSTFRGTHER
jgi:hypothetical protein